MKKDLNIYRNDYLQFYIEKPAEWDFIPQRWADNFREKKVENNPEFREMLEKAVVPFTQFCKHHANQNYPLPTVQCGCRLFKQPFEYKREELLAFILNYHAQNFKKNEILESSSNFIISNKPSIYYKMKFQILNANNEPIECLSRTIQVDNGSFVFTIGLTGSTEGEYKCEEEFIEIIRSIKIGK